MPFVVEKVVKLDHLGEGWAGAEVALNALSFKETEEISNLGVDPDNTDAEKNKQSYGVISGLLEKKFVRGQAFDGEKLVDLQASDLVDLPVEVVNEVIKALAGTVSPNS